MRRKMEHPGTTHLLGVSCLCALMLGGSGFKSGLNSIERADLEQHLEHLAGPELEGRDSPSLGLDRAGAYLASAFEELGLEPLDEAGFLRTFERWLPRPEPAGCRLELAGDPPLQLEYGEDFVPLAHFTGEARGELVFAGFGIASKAERYEGLRGDLEDAVVMILEGEPDHPRSFDGRDEVTRHASLWTKLENLRRAGAAGAIIVRRQATGGPLSFRHTWATWSTEAMTAVPGDLHPERIPAIEVSLTCASKLLGEDVEALAADLDRTGRPERPAASDRRVAFSSASALGTVLLANVAARLPGEDPELAGEVVVVGAHYDHVGVDERGRIGCGADDNGSGTAALLEIAEALSTSGARRTVVFCAFAAEEDGLLGSRAFCRDPALELSDVVAMLNMDMLARGKGQEVAVLGVKRNPALGKLLARARSLGTTGISKLVLRQGEELWTRSDHYSFHEQGIPSLFFFEGLPISRNPDYHTWRDTIDRLDFDKLTRTTRLVFNTAWLLADDDERPPAPRD